MPTTVHFSHDFWTDFDLALGEWKKGFFDGNGIFVHLTGVVIKARFSKGKLDGLAEAFYSREAKILSLWKDGNFYEESTFVKAQKPAKCKDFLEGLLNGKESYFKSKDQGNGFHDAVFDKKYRFFGNWKNGKPNGLGFSLTHNSIEIGEYKNGFLNGFCRKILLNGSVISGFFRQNLLQGSCLQYEIEKGIWSLCAFKNNENVELLREGICDYPPVLKCVKEKANVLPESLNEEIVEKKDLEKILEIYGKNEPSSPIKIPIIEINEEPATFTTIYNQIIDKQHSPNPPNGVSKQKNSPNTIKLLSSSYHGSFFSKGGTSSRGDTPSKGNPYSKGDSSSKGDTPSQNRVASSPFATLENFNKKSKTKRSDQTSNIFLDVQKKNTITFGSLKKPSSPLKILPCSSQLKRSSASQILNTFDNHCKTALLSYKSQPNGFHSPSFSRNISAVYLSKDSSPIFNLEPERRKGESPINHYIQKLKNASSPSPNKKCVDFCQEIEGVNSIIEAALTEDSNFNKKSLRQKNQGFTLKMVNDK